PGIAHVAFNLGGPHHGPPSLLSLRRQRMTDLREAWRDLLVRRRALAPSLAPYGRLLDRWRQCNATAPRFTWSAPRCRERWVRVGRRAAQAPPPLQVADVEDLLGAAMEDVAALDGTRAAALQRLAASWDAGAVGPDSLLPRRDGIGDGRVETA